MSLTDLKIKIPRGARSGVVKKLFTEAEILEKWEQTAWAKKLAARKKKASMTDFDRFKLKLAKQRVSVNICKTNVVSLCSQKVTYNMESWSNGVKSTHITSYYLKQI